MPAELFPESHRDLPEWQAARAEYLAADDDPDRKFMRSVRGAMRMLEIEKAFAAGIRLPIWLDMLGEQRCRVMNMSELRSERFSITLTPSALAKLDAYAAEHRWTRSTAAAELIERGLEDDEGSEEQK